MTALAPAARTATTRSGPSTSARRPRRRLCPWRRRRLARCERPTARSRAKVPRRGGVRELRRRAARPAARRKRHRKVEEDERRRRRARPAAWRVVGSPRRIAGGPGGSGTDRASYLGRSPGPGATSPSNGARRPLGPPRLPPPRSRRRRARGRSSATATTCRTLARSRNGSRGGGTGCASLAPSLDQPARRRRALRGRARAEPGTMIGVAGFHALDADASRAYLAVCARRSPAAARERASAGTAMADARPVGSRFTVGVEGVVAGPRPRTNPRCSSSRTGAFACPPFSSDGKSGGVRAQTFRRRALSTRPESVRV